MTPYPKEKHATVNYKDAQKVEASFRHPLKSEPPPTLSSNN